MSLVVATSTLLPATPSAAAATSPGGAMDTVQLEVEAVKPKPAFYKMSVVPMFVTKNGNDTDYHFRVQADVGTLKDVKVSPAVYYRTIVTHEFAGVSQQPEYSLGTFSAPDYRTVIVACRPKPYHYCDMGAVHVTTSNGGVKHVENGENGNMLLP